MSSVVRLAHLLYIVQTIATCTRKSADVSLQTFISLLLKIIEIKNIDCTQLLNRNRIVNNNQNSNLKWSIKSH